MTGKYKDVVFHFVKHFMDECEVFLDVGAHAGYYTLALAKIFAPNIILSFEPFDFTFTILKLNILHKQNYECGTT